MRRNLIHPLIAMMLHSASQSKIPHHDVASPYQMSSFGYSGIVGNGKGRKKKSNKLHHSRMLKRKHAKK